MNGFLTENFYCKFFIVYYCLCRRRPLDIGPKYSNRFCWFTVFGKSHHYSLFCSCIMERQCSLRHYLIIIVFYLRLSWVLIRLFTFFATYSFKNIWFVERGTIYNLLKSETCNYFQSVWLKRAELSCGLFNTSSQRRLHTSGGPRPEKGGRAASPNFSDILH